MCAYVTENGVAYMHYF